MTQAFKTFAIGDIHGCLTALEKLLRVVPIRPSDEIITLGDYVDRGPDSRGVIRKLIELRDTHWLIPLRGNHDVMMLNARASRAAFKQWLPYGARATMESYGTPEDLSSVPETHWQFLEETRPYYETDRHFFVHANAHPERPLTQQLDEALYWEKLDNEARAHGSGKVMVCGHTSQKSGQILNLGHTICIDTRVYDRGWLTCLEVNSGEYWQANEQRELRTGRLT